MSKAQELAAEVEGLERGKHRRRRYPADLRRRITDRVRERRAGESRPTKFVLTTLPRRLTKKAIVRIIMERWRTERAYEELKGELGLDHFEGRSFPGWHHHISVVLCCYASSSPSVCGVFPPRSDGKLPTIRSRSRPERHFADSFITVRLAIARAIIRWPPRCPFCHRACDDHSHTGHY
jgi:hypothetical protein